MGVLTICIAAGVRNCAVAILPDSVEMMRLKRSLTEGGSSASFGAMMEGRLKEAKIVMESLAAKRAKESFGMVAAGPDDGLPKSRANWLSLYTHIDMLTAEVAKNLDAFEATVSAGLPARVEVTVSTLFAVKYVEK